MKQYFISILIVLCPLLARAQHNVGTSTTVKTDVFGNTTTTHKDRYGHTTGTSTTGKTDVFGNTSTTQKRNDSNSSIWTW